MFNRSQRDFHFHSTCLNTIRVASLVLLLGASLAAAQCPEVHVFGARETTVASGYGSAASVVSAIQSAFPGTTAEAMNYPACGGQASCGDVSYAQSVIDGVAAVASQVNTFNSQCPNAVLVLVGYSQVSGGRVVKSWMMHTGDTNEGLSSTAILISSAAQKKIAAAIFMGDPRHIPGLSYNIGTCEASGFAPRPAGFQCPYAANIQSYCDASEPYCCNGENAATHEGYATEYGAVALTFVKNKVNAVLGGSTGTGTGSGTVAEYGQCGGIGWTGGTVCVLPYTCQVLNSYYSQCL
ncbi:putative acetyl xylan esterase [Mycena sanguinolenta]|nr:putative acetyl xylan esterase [Mycena sanguinolenta]